MALLPHFGLSTASSRSESSHRAKIVKDDASICRSPVETMRQHSPSTSEPDTNVTGAFCHVALRLKPAEPGECAEEVWSVDSEKGYITCADSPDKKRIEAFKFDSVFEGSDNQLLYNIAVNDLVKECMEGVDATALAYGQTNSGKTFSMMGCEEQPGIIPQAINDVFNYIRDQSDNREFLLRASYLEIYNERIRDLLAPEQKELRLSSSRTRLVCVSNLREEIVTSPMQLMKLIKTGETNRSSSSTEVNENSSRSHTIFQLTIESRSLSDAPEMLVLQSQLNLIDLAGSEKATNDTDRRKESSFINKSLLTLGIVIAKIIQEVPGHIPFRDSKLTRLLQSSLQGQARILILCTISPTLENFEESLSTLKFAARAKQMTPSPERNEVTDEKTLLRKYKVEIEGLKLKLLNTQNRDLDSSEKEAYELQLEDSRLARTSLVCRIDYIAKLILSSETKFKPLLDWNTQSSKLYKRSSVILQRGILPSISSTQLTSKEDLLATIPPHDLESGAMCKLSELEIVADEQAETIIALELRYNEFLRFVQSDQKMMQDLIDELREKVNILKRKSLCNGRMTLSTAEILRTLIRKEYSETKEVNGTQFKEISDEIDSLVGLKCTQSGLKDIDDRENQ